jgi:peptide deformylase
MPVDPASLHIRTYPDPILRKPAGPVPAVNDEVRAVVKRMVQIMREEHGIGLAAPQVGLSWRLFIADVPAKEAHDGDGPAEPTPYPTTTDGLVAYINPVISQVSPVPPIEPGEEGCLSLPEIRGQVQRPPTVTITYTTIEGEKKTETATGLLARCWQHEADHLDGVLIIDKFTPMSRLKNKFKVRQLEREAE